MQKLMAELDKNFDLIVYAMPPLMELADVSLIAGDTDGVLITTALGRRSVASALDRTLERLQMARVPVIGLVVNRVKHHTVDLYARSA